MNICLAILALLVTGCVSIEIVEGPTCPISDPYVVGQTFLNVSSTMLNFLNGSGIDGSFVEGLSNFSYKITFQDGPAYSLTIEAWMDSGRIWGGKYDASGLIDFSPFRSQTIPRGDFMGKGNFEGSVSNFHIETKMSFSVFDIINRKTVIQLLEVKSLSFENPAVDIRNLEVDGEMINWPEWTNNFKQNFEEDFATIRNQFLEKLRLVLNNELRSYSFDEFLKCFGIYETPVPCEINKYQKYN